MTRQTLFLSLFASIVVVSLSASVALAQGQGFGFIQDDYNKYAQLFKTGRDPNLGPVEGGGSSTWRRLYSNHLWKDYAEGSEFRDPMLAAQTLMAIYLTTEVDYRLSHQIDTIILNKAALGAELSERMTLDLINDYFDTRASDDERFADKIDAAGSGEDFYMPEEIDRIEDPLGMGFINVTRSIDRRARMRLISGTGIARARLGEVRTIQNLFRNSEKGWEPMYYHMREKINVLDELAGTFIFNWEKEDREEKRQAILNELLEDYDVKREARRRAEEELMPATGGPGGMMMGGTGSTMGGGMMGGYSGGMMGGYPGGMMGGYPGGMMGGYPGGMGMDGMSDPTGMPGTGLGSTATRKPTEEEIAEKVKEVAEERLEWMEARHKAYRYVVGVYQSAGYHMETLQKIYSYYRNAANTGDPIAQYHLALFIKNLGDIVDPYTYPNANECESAYRQWLNRARASEIAKKRVEELEAQVAEAADKQRRRDLDYEKKLLALVKVEEDKLDMFDDILIRVRARIAGGGSGSSGSGSYSSGSGMSTGSRGNQTGSSMGGNSRGNQSGGMGTSGRNSSRSGSSSRGGSSRGGYGY